MHHLLTPVQQGAVVVVYSPSLTLHLLSSPFYQPSVHKGIKWNNVTGLYWMNYYQLVTEIQKTPQKTDVCVYENASCQYSLATSPGFPVDFCNATLMEEKITQARGASVASA